MVKKLLKGLGVCAAVFVVAALAVYLWAGMATDRLLSQTIETHSVDFPIPFPVDPAEIAATGLTAEAAQQLARQRAVDRGKHLVSARYPCTACHGANFGGGTMIDAFPIGRLLAPNLTAGAGSRARDLQPRDWDRIVRHGVLKDGHPAVMPAEDFQSMSDQELSDVISYIRSLPPVDNTVPAPAFGPLGKLLVATGRLKPAATVIHTHTTPHLVSPPEAAVSAEFGKHLASVCLGCHGQDLSGGPIPGGDPAWPPAANITPDPTGLKGWSYDQFATVLTEGKRPDGVALRDPMSLITSYGQKMTDVERRALWAYLQSLPPVSKTISMK